MVSREVWFKSAKNTILEKQSYSIYSKLMGALQLAERLLQLDVRPGTEQLTCLVQHF